MIVKQVFKINQFISRISASAGFLAKPEKGNEEGNDIGSRSLFKEKNQKDETKGLREQISSLVQKINEANKYFLGVKYNTNYLKVNKVLTYEEASALTAQKATINDIPIELSAKQLDSELFNSVSQENALAQKSAQVVFSHSRLEPTINQMKNIVKKFIINIGKKARLEKIQPNFELQIMKTFKALGNAQFILQNEEAEPEIRIKSVTLLKGLSVYRNANYSTDSFDKNESQAADGIISYKLYRQLKEQYPEIQWFSTKNINARFEILVKGGPSLKVKSEGVQLGSTANTIHSVVIETDLVPPPLYSEHLLTPQQFLRSYRLKYNSLVLTNFDRKNQFYPLTYTETQKKTILINKIT